MQESTVPLTAAGPRERRDVILINMPFFGVSRPNLGLSLIQASLRERGIRSAVEYFNLVFAAIVGTSFFDLVDSLPKSYLLGEWIFSNALWGSDPAIDRKYFALLEGTGAEPQCVSQLAKLTRGDQDRIISCREAVEAFLSHCLSRVADWQDVRIVGFSSIFQQQTAALALARRLKEHFPHVCLIFGGANCEAGMGDALLRNFHFIDAVCTGAGELAFPEFAAQYLAESTLRPIGPIKTRTASDRDSILLNQGAPENVTADQAPNLNALPYPNFDDYFLQKEQLHLPFASQLVFETSRGCWWGQRSHCTFCGLNGSQIRFRQKTAERALREIGYLKLKYGKYSRHFIAVDNIIPNNYFDSLLPELAKNKLGLELFFETKANLTKTQVELCRAAGINDIQPGIESLSTAVLRLMRKGTSSLQNIQLLKFCKQFGVRPTWNYLIGFPGERPEDYLDQPRTIAAISHLDPPTPPGLQIVRFDRFSPYHTEPGKFGIKSLTPHPAYRLVYREISEEELDELAYFFVTSEHVSVPSYFSAIDRAIKGWLEQHQSSALFSTLLPGGKFVICDLRPTANRPFTVLSSVQRLLNEACENICTISELHCELQRHLKREVGKDELEGSLGSLLEEGFLICEGSQFLSLVVPLSSFRLNDLQIRRLCCALSEQNPLRTEIHRV